MSQGNGSQNQGRGQPEAMKIRRVSNPGLGGPQQTSRVTKMGQGRRPTSSVLVSTTGSKNEMAEGGPKDQGFQSEMERYLTSNYPQKGQGRYRGSFVRELKDEDELDTVISKKLTDITMKEGKGGFQNIGEVSATDNLAKDIENQAHWDIAMTRLSLVNDDFVHKSRYTSGAAFGFERYTLRRPNFLVEEDLTKAKTYKGDKADKATK